MNRRLSTSGCWQVLDADVLVYNTPDGWRLSSERSPNWLTLLDRHGLRGQTFATRAEALRAYDLMRRVEQSNGTLEEALAPYPAPARTGNDMFRSSQQIGEQVQLLRREAGKSIADIAAASDRWIDEDELQAIEAGDVSATSYQLSVLTEQLNVTLDDLMLLPDLSFTEQLHRAAHSLALCHEVVHLSRNMHLHPRSPYGEPVDPISDEDHARMLAEIPEEEDAVLGLASQLRAPR